MKDLDGKVAVVTGAAGGIGRGMARAFARAGMRVVVSDIDGVGAKTVATEIGGVAAETDVTDSESVRSLADLAFSEFGEVNVLCNNAGISLGELPIAKATLDDWRWTLSVNLDGVVHGIHAFLPRMLESGAPGHIVNTASLAGIATFPGLGPYTASKAAVVGISEVLAAELRKTAIRVSVLCPGQTNTGILESSRVRPASLPDTASSPVPDAMKESFARDGMDPDDVGELVRRAVEDDTFYILSHKDGLYRDLILARSERLRAAVQKPS